MNKNYIILLITLLTIASCGKSKEQIELEKTKLELEKIKLELVEKAKSEENEKRELEILKIHEQRVNVGKSKKLTELNDALLSTNTKISEAEKKYNNLKEFQFGRSQATKDEQLREVLNEINLASNYAKNIKNEIAELELIKTFDFQQKPEEVVKHLFFAAKNRDFSKLRYLCDPYAENDSDSKGICYTEMLPEAGRNRFIENFEEGRIIGEPVIKGDIAEVEFAFGKGSNRLEKMGLIKRMDKWYIASL